MKGGEFVSIRGGVSLVAVAIVLAAALLSGDLSRWFELLFNQHPVIGVVVALIVVVFFWIVVIPKKENK